EYLLFDPEVTRQRLAGKAPVELFESPPANQLVFGQCATVRAECKPDSRPRFDYAAEVAAARRAFPDLLRRFSLPDALLPLTMPMVGDGAPAQIAVTGVQWMFPEAETSKRIEIPLWRFSSGYTLHLLAHLPGPVPEVQKIEITRAVTLEGATLKADVRGD